MAKVLPLAKVGLSGLNTDTAPWDLPPEFVTSGNNFRVSDGAMLTSNGVLLLQDYNISDLGLTKVFYIGSLNNDMYIVTSKSSVWSWDGSQFSVILQLPRPLIRPQDWSLCMLSGIPVMNHPEAGAFYWANPGHNNPLVPLPYDKTSNWDAPDAQHALIIRSYKNFLFMLNLVESDANGVAVVMPDAFRWSHPADINRIPVTWNEADQYFLAGIANLGANSGPILDALALHDSFCIYSENSINHLSYTRDTLVWDRQEQSVTTGILSTDCVVDIKGTHFLIAAGDIVTNNGSGLESIIHGRLRKSFNANLSSTHYRNSFVVKDNVWKEVWFCIPTTDSPWATMAYVYNWKDDSWAVRDLPNVAHAAYGSYRQGVLTWDALSKISPIPTWERYSQPWQSHKKSPLDETIIGVIEDKIFDIDPTSSFVTTVDENNEYTDSFFERLFYSPEGQTNVTTIVAVYPHITGPSPVLIKLGSHNSSGSAVRWKEPVLFTPGVDRKLNIRTTGELHAWRLESVNGGKFTFSGMDIEYTGAGLR